MTLDSRMQYQDTNICTRQVAIRVFCHHIIERIASGRRTWITTQTCHRYAHTCRLNQNGLDAVRFREVVNTPKFGIDTLRSETTMLSTLAWRIMIATDAECLNTSRMQARKLCGDEFALQIAWLDAVEKIACLDEQMGLPGNSLIHHPRECPAQPLPTFAQSLWREFRCKCRKMVVGRHHHPQNIIRPHIFMFPLTLPSLTRIFAAIQITHPAPSLSSQTSHLASARSTPNRHHSSR